MSRSAFCIDPRNIYSLFFLEKICWLILLFLADKIEASLTRPDQKKSDEDSDQEKGRCLRGVGVVGPGQANFMVI